MHRRTFFLSTLAASASAARRASALPFGIEGEEHPAMKTPNLAPSLTAAEVEQALGAWKMENATREARAGASYVSGLAKARVSMLEYLPRATSITLYSLYPLKGKELQELSSKDEAKALEQRPAFHGYPILGSVQLDNKDEAGEWSAFLKNQIIPTASGLCTFMPRHGIRLTKGSQSTDIVICFTCQIMGIMTQKTPQPQTVFSPGVQAVMNHLFDKNGVQRNLDPWSRPRGTDK